MCKGCHASNSATPHPQLRKIKQIATPKNLHGGLRCAKWGWRLKAKLGLGAKRATPPTPLPQHRKIKQIALAENFAEKNG